MHNVVSVKEPIAAARLDALAGSKVGLVGDERGQKGWGMGEGWGRNDHAAAPRRPRRRLQVNAFPSWIEVLGSPTTALSMLAISPRAKPSQPKCQTNPTSWTVWSSSLNGRTRSVTRALTSTSPRKVETVTQSRLWTPSEWASSGEISANASACNSAATGTERVAMPPAWYGRPICRQRIRKARVGRGVQPVVGTLPDFGNGTALLAIERVLDGRFHRLVVRPDRRVLQARWGEQRGPAIGDHDERAVHAERLPALVSLISIP